MVAAHKGHREIASMLLKHGAEVNAKSIEGTELLIFAAKEGEKELASLLLEKGAALMLKINGGP